MTVAATPRHKRVFIASSQADLTEIRKALQQLDLDAVTLEHSAEPGTTWLESLHRCVNDADMVVGIMGDQRKNGNVLFELGVASALNKPTLLFITPEYPANQAPPFDIPYLRTDVRNEDAVAFGLKQMLSLSQRDRVRRPSGGFTTTPIGRTADELLARLAATTPREFEDLIYEAIKATGARTIARGSEAEDMGVDFAVWSLDLEPAIANPLLVECKSDLGHSAAVDQVIGRMYRALQPIHNGFGIVVYKDAGGVPKAAPASLAVTFVSAEEFIKGLRDTGLAAYVRELRNNAFHGF